MELLEIVMMQLNLKFMETQLHGENIEFQEKLKHSKNYIYMVLERIFIVVKPVN